MKSLLTSLLACVLLITGCASAGTNFDESKIAQIKKGETTEAELIEMFGATQNRITNSDGATTLIWSYAQSTVSGQSFIPIAGAFMGGAHTTAKSLTVTLADGKVRDYTFSGGGSETRNTTQGVQK